jgi:hypothetical protein
MKRIGLVLVLSITISSIFLNAWAAPQVGGPCKTLGSITHIGGVSYTCQQVGKNKIYALPKKVSAPPSTSEQTKAAPIELVRTKAFSALNPKVCSTNHSNIELTYQIAPDYSPDGAKKQKELFDSIANCYNNFFGRKIGVSIYLFTQNDLSLLESMKDTSGSALFDSAQINWARSQMDHISATGSGNGVRFAGSAAWSVSHQNAWSILINSTYGPSADAHVAAHEFVHILQTFARRQGFALPSEDSLSVPDGLPDWYWEGTAELFSFATISQNIADFNSYMDVAKSEAKNSPSINHIMDESVLIQRMQAIVSPTNQDDIGMAYALGKMICEYFLGTYGYDKYLALIHATGVHQNFSDALMATVGKNQDQLFKDSAPYILSQWEKANF